MFGKSLILTLSFLLAPAVAMAGGRKEEDLVKALAKYEKTGNVERCILTSRIRTSKVIDDYNILFIMKGKKAYLNTMKHRCSRLGFEKSFIYELHVNQLCNVDIITVFDSTGGIRGPSCGLEKFVEYKKKPKEDKKE
ncbi:MAG TPA: hypothetical protein ENI91_08140 [Sphingomonadales bacterium]|nr:hypothetical protein [Sphingomonadales bacterium]